MTTILIILAILTAFTLGCVACWLTIGWKYRLGEKRIAEAERLERDADTSILNSNIRALIELLTYDGVRTRGEGSVLTGETLDEYRERTVTNG